MEFLTSGILGSLFGGLFRLAPELLKWFDRKDERSHELKMFSLQTDLEKIKGTQKLDERYIDYSIAQTGAIENALAGQAKEAASSYKWVAALSALVRPLVTYVLFGLYVSFKIAVISYAMSSNALWSEVIIKNWTADDFAMLNMILTFWFVGRSIEKRN